MRKFTICSIYSQGEDTREVPRCSMYFFHVNSFFAYFFYVDRRVIPRLQSAFSAFHAYSIPRLQETAHLQLLRREGGQVQHVLILGVLLQQFTSDFGEAL